MKFSPVLLALVMVSAVMCAEYADVKNICIFLSLFCVAFVVRCIFFRKIDFAMIVLSVGFVCAFLSHTFFTGSFNHRSTEYIDRYVTFSGYVITQPQKIRTGDGFRYILKTENIYVDSSVRPLKDVVLLTTDEKLSCGTEVMVSGIVKSMRVQMNENGFDMAKYYKSQNIYTRIYSEEITQSGCTDSISPYIITGKVREKIDEVINRYYYGDSAAILSAVLTGNTAYFSDSYSKDISRTGFSRLFHPAYIHIMMITFFVGLFSNLVHRKIRDIVLVLIFLVYAVCNCTQIGFVRCFVMALMSIIFRYKDGSSHYPDSMAYLCIICSVLCPTVFLNAGFVMSVSAGLIMWAFMPFVSKWYWSMPSFLGRTMSAMTVCALFYTPISSLYFNGLCIYSFLLPFVMIPIVVCMLVLSPLVLTGLSLVGNVPILKSYLDLMIWIVWRLPELISDLPYSYISIPSPSPSSFLASLFLIFGIYYLFRKEKQKRNISFFLSSAFAVSVAVTAISKVGQVQFTFVNVGQGDGAVIHRAFGETVIIDGGGGNEYSAYNPGESIFVPYLSSKGYGRIDCAFVSHLHKDHIQGVISAIEMLDVENLFIASDTNDNEESMAKWRTEIENAAKENGTEIHYLYGNERIHFKSGLMIDVYPHNDVIDFSSDGNDSSLMMKISYGQNSVLYTGDMTDYSEKQYIKSGMDIDVDILKVAHHGSASSTSGQWLEYIRPEYAVISCGEDNSYGHPSKAVLERLEGCKVFRTDRNGDITFVADKNEIKNIRTLR